MSAATFKKFRIGVTIQTQDVVKATNPQRRGLCGRGLPVPLAHTCSSSAQRLWFSLNLLPDVLRSSFRPSWRYMATLLLCVLVLCTINPSTSPLSWFPLLAPTYKPPTNTSLCAALVSVHLFFLLPSFTNPPSRHIKPSHILLWT